MLSLEKKTDKNCHVSENPRHEYSARLKSLMEKESVSSYRLAQELGAKQSAVAMWLSQGSVPRKPMLMRLCERFGVREDWLMNGHGPKYLQSEKPQDELPADMRADLRKIASAAQHNPDLREIIIRLARISSSR